MNSINLPDDNPKAPFSGAILSGNTLFVSGRIGIDSKTGNAPANLDEEIKLLLDHVENTLVGGHDDGRSRVRTALFDLKMATPVKTLCAWPDSQQPPEQQLRP